VDIFGGWLIAQKYLAGNNATAFKAKGSVEVSSICDPLLRQFILVGDELSYYGEVIRMSHSTLTINVEAFVHRSRQKRDVKVTVRIFTFITIDR
jgi:acyl-CoA thioesterase YciA